MHTAIVILNWNTADYLKRFVPGILHSIEGLDAELIVADSASTDGSMAMMAEEFPDVRRIALDKNYGFTGGYNRALAQVEADLYVLINSDIEVQDGWLQPLVRTMQENEDVGACAPKLHSWFSRDTFEYAGAAGGYLDKFGFPFCRGRLMKMVEKDEGQYDSPADVLWATGACLMVRSSLYKALGGLDDRFFAHMEEIDLCWRMQLLGYKVRIVPQSVVYHLGGGTLPQASPWKLKLNYRNNLLLLENNLARTNALKGLRQALETAPLSNASGQAGDTDIQYGKIAKRACRAARQRIFLRMLIDGCTGAVYLATFKWNYVKAVIEAHREYRKLVRRASAEEIAAWLKEISNGGGPIPQDRTIPQIQTIPQVHGLYGKWIIPQAVIRGEKTFNMVHRING